MAEKSQSEIIKDILNIPAETQTIEFKRLVEDKQVKKILETIVAMANTDGGYIIIGIDDPEKTKLKGINRIYGIEENIEVYDALGREVAKIAPHLPDIWPPAIFDVKENNKRFALLRVPKAIDSFRSINDHVYVRQEKGNRRLTAHEAVKFAYAKGFEKADSGLVDVDFNLLKTQYFDEWKEIRRINGGPIETILEKTGLARKNDKRKLLPTFAAVLLFCEYPNDLTDTKCTIRVLQYTGTLENIAEVPNLIGVPKTIHGPLIKQIYDAHDYVLTLLRSGIKIPSGFKTQYQIPERAVKESITNAVIHRDYHMKRDIEVKIYEDRIEIESPGLFPYNITKANIGLERAEKYRNDLVVKHLREFPSPPNLDQNEGVRAMRSEMAARNLYPPIFLTYPVFKDSVKVILFNEYRATEWEKISNYLKANKYITNEEARKISGVVQHYKMARLLRKWVEHGLIIKIVPHTGYAKGIKYKLADMQEVK